MIDDEVQSLTIQACFPKTAYTLDSHGDGPSEQPFKSSLDVDLRWNRSKSADLYLGANNCFYGDAKGLFQSRIRGFSSSNLTLMKLTAVFVFRNTTSSHKEWRETMREIK